MSAESEIGSHGSDGAKSISPEERKEELVSTWLQQGPPLVFFSLMREREREKERKRKMAIQKRIIIYFTLVFFCSLFFICV